MRRSISTTEVTTPSSLFGGDDTVGESGHWKGYWTLRGIVLPGQADQVVDQSICKF